MKEEMIGAGGAGPVSPPQSVPTGPRSPARQGLHQFAELRGVSGGSPGEGATRAAPDVDASPLDLAVGRETVRGYERALARLRPRDREAVLGRVELQWPYEQLAEALGVATPQAARAVVIRAIGRLVAAMDR